VRCRGGGRARTRREHQHRRERGPVHVAARREASAEGTAHAPGDGILIESGTVPIQFKTSGCVFSIIASIVLTIVLNLLLRSCA
jgi:hypothetical protein